MSFDYHNECHKNSLHYCSKCDQFFQDEFDEHFGTRTHRSSKRRKARITAPPSESSSQGIIPLFLSFLSFSHPVTEVPSRETDQSTVLSSSPSDPLSQIYEINQSSPTIPLATEETEPVATPASQEATLLSIFPLFFFLFAVMNILTLIFFCFIFQVKMTLAILLVNCTQKVNLEHKKHQANRHFSSTWTFWFHILLRATTNT
jgi:hypothetical protein